jgi:HemY protein
MIRVLLYLLVLALLAYGGMILVENPGHVTLTWYGKIIEAPAALLIGLIAVAAVVVWSLFRFVFGLPSFLRLAARQRRREKGYSALSRGLIAVGAGDARTANYAALQASKHLKADPLALMLRAQAAHLSGDLAAARAAYEELARREETKILGLRGLHADAVRRGDEEAARHFATAAHGTSALPWSAQAVLEQRAADGEWEKALATVEAALAARLVDRATGERQRAVLETAIAYQKEQASPDEALALARAAMRRAPDLVPATVLATRLLTRRGDIRKAAKTVEKAWTRAQHPELAQAYLDVRPGDSTQDRLARAKTLMGIAAFDPISRMTVARAALAAKDFATARETMAPLVAEGKRPSVRQCLIMADLEEAEHGDAGLAREWLARAARAPFDPAWIADGIVYERWAPTSPTTGRLDAFEWHAPAERLGPAIEALPAATPSPAPASRAIASPTAPAPLEDARPQTVLAPPPAAIEVPAPIASEPLEAEASEPPPADPVPAAPDLQASPEVADASHAAQPDHDVDQAAASPAAKAALLPAARHDKIALFHRRVAQPAPAAAPPLSNGAAHPVTDEAGEEAASQEMLPSSETESPTQH